LPGVSRRIFRELRQLGDELHGVSVRSVHSGIRVHELHVMPRGILRQLSHCSHFMLCLSLGILHRQLWLHDLFNLSSRIHLVHRDHVLLPLPVSAAHQSSLGPSKRASNCATNFCADSTAQLPAFYPPDHASKRSAIEETVVDPVSAAIRVPQLPSFVPAFLSTFQPAYKAADKSAVFVPLGSAIWAAIRTTFR
jgi:hypothetical protein